MQNLKEFLSIYQPKNYVLYDRNRTPLSDELIKNIDFSDVDVLKYEIKDEKYHIYTDVYLGGC